MGDVILNVVLALVAALIAWLSIYFCPPMIASFIDRVLYRVSIPFRWMLRPILRFMDITDRELE